MIVKLSIKIEAEPTMSSENKVTINVTFGREDTTGFINKEFKQRKYENVPIDVYESFIKNMSNILDHEMLYFSLLLETNFGITYK